MRRPLTPCIVSLFLLGGACASRTSITPVTPPTPADAPSPVPASADIPPNQPAPAPVPKPVQADSVFDLRQAQDSAADAAVLEQLNAAHPPDSQPASPGGDLLEALTESRVNSLALSQYANHERVRYYLDFFLGPARSRMAIWLERMPAYEPMVRRRFEAAGLPGDLVYLGLIESGFSNVAVSRSRAVGMWQFVRGTGRWMGLRVDRWVDERRDPVKATDAAARYLAMLTEQFGGSHFLAAAAYNAGPGRVSRGLERLGPNGAAGDAAADDVGEDEGWSDDHFFSLADTRYIKQETKDYVPKLIAASLIARNPEAYGFAPTPAVDPYPADSIVVPDMTGLDVVAKLAGVPLAVLRSLNPHYLRLATPPGRASVVRLPAGAQERVALAYAALPKRERVRFREHVVARGETMGQIARRYGVSLAELQDANPRARPKALAIGQALVVPVAGGGPAPAAAPERSAPAARPTGGVHVVRSGETLTRIADRYGVSVANLRAWNALGGSSVIKVGQRLRVGEGAGNTAVSGSSARSNTVHVVKRGETLSSLSRRYGVSVQAIMRANGMSSTRLAAGKRLTIPS